jgi:hypothetical protein
LNNSIDQIVEILRFPELLSESTYAFSLNGESLFKQWWDGEEDAHSLHLGKISKKQFEDIMQIVMSADGEIVSKHVGHIEKIINDFRILALNPPLSAEPHIEFFRLGSIGFPWNNIKRCIDNKWPFILTKEKLLYIQEGFTLKEEPSNYKLLQAVKGAFHRNMKRMELTDGIYQQKQVPINSYTLTNGDNVLVYFQSSPVEIHYLPKH